MTILTAAQAAIAKLVGRRPPAVVSSTEEICVEITALAQEAAVEIAKAYDWQSLSRTHNINGDGNTTSFPFPDDYDRMIQASEVHDPNTWFWNYTHIPNYDEFLNYVNGEFALITPGIWIVIQNHFLFHPAPPMQARAQIPYITNSIIQSQDGSLKDEITSDDDTFVLSERLLTLALLWKYKAMKGLDYQQEIDDYNLALSQATARDKGARTIRSRNRLLPLAVRPAYPWPLGS